MMNEWRQTIMRYIIPQYDEVALFAMSLTCILLVTAGLCSAEAGMHFQLSTGDDFKMLLILILLLAGLALSLYHAFVDRPKSLLEKYLMLLFAVTLNAFSGLLSGAYAFNNTTGWLAAFPAINIVNGMVLLFLLRSQALDESHVSDKNASHIQVAVTAAVVIILFTLCQYVFGLLWVQTLSVCIAYATNIGRRVQILLWWIPSKKKTA